MTLTFIFWNQSFELVSLSILLNIWFSFLSFLHFFVQFLKTTKANNKKVFMIENVKLSDLFHSSSSTEKTIGF